jgi:hypothetical protein
VTVPLRPVAVNVLGVVEHPTSGPGPYRVGRDGVPYLPVGDGGIVPVTATTSPPASA